MGLPDPAGAHEQKAAAVVRHGPGVDELLDAPPRGDEGRRVLVVERLERAVVEITLGNARRRDALPPAQIALTVARIHPELVPRHRNPSGAVAPRTGGRLGDGGHAWSVYRKGLVRRQRAEGRSAYRGALHFCLLPSAHCPLPQTSISSLPNASRTVRASVRPSS